MTATQIKERPILFNGEMVRAILEGRKTQTRRVVKPQPVPSEHEPGVWLRSRGRVVYDTNVRRWDVHNADTDELVDSHERKLSVPEWLSPMCPFGQPGERLWVRETWRPKVAHSCTDTCDCADIWIDYPADGAGRYLSEREVPDEWLLPQAAKRGNVPSIHMPRWASRLTLEITDVRVERLQDISNEDAIAEGFDDTPEGWNLAHQQFAGKWEELNAKTHPWESNPWVWAISFKRVEGEVTE